ncbi:MAG: nuclear transport factor 2 family protein [Gammaproteobacteria bacterium]|nr:nuclear transport factor 2 family protein [Gammaproteobacteria bacterium]
MTAASASEAAVRAYIAALNAGDADRIAACVTEDFVNEHASSSGRTVIGREAYRDRLATFLREFRDLRYQVEEIIVDGDRVAVPYIVSANWVAPDTEIVAARPFSLRGMFRFRIAGGLIAHRVDYWDATDFQRQVQSPES